MLIDTRRVLALTISDILCTPLAFCSKSFLRVFQNHFSTRSPRLCVHCVAAYLLTAIVVKELLIEYDAFRHVRHRYLLSREPHLRTVLVTNIPRQLRTPSKITSYFKNVYPDAVVSVPNM